MNKLVAILTICLSLGASAHDYTHNIRDNGIDFVSEDNMATFSMDFIEPIEGLSTTMDYAQYLMDSYQGWQLRPQLALKGFSFKYVDNAPCAAVVAFHDGTDYLMYRSCGQMNKLEVKSLVKEAHHLLNQNRKR